ncbi:MAG: SAM-dependent methyltransferase, partial [Gemmatimonadales bacterium]
MHLVGDRVLRVVGRAGAGDLDAFLGSPAIRRLAADGRVVVTWELAPEEARAAGVLAGPGERVLEHERIPFPSYPYEWPPEMLDAAARLTLDVSDALLGEGLGLKDATPYNVLFRGSRPVFVDVLSVERREPHDPIWLAAGQLERTFLLPLLAARHFGLPPATVFQAARDGIEPEALYGMLGPVRRLRPPFLGLVTLPTWLSRRDAGDPAAYRARLAPSPERARYVLAFLYRRLRRTLQR